MLTKEQQIFFRSELLSNLNIKKLDEIQSERDKLIDELVQVVYRVASASNIYITSADAVFMAEMVADEIGGYGPIRELMEDDTVNDILVNGPDDVWIERAGILEKTEKYFVNNEQLTILQNVWLLELDGVLMMVAHLSTHVYLTEAV